MGWVRRLRIYFLRLLLSASVLLLVLLFALYLPPVQSYLTGRLTSFLQRKLQTEVRIDAIRLRPPASLVLKGVYLEDQRRDTLLNVSELSLRIRLAKLLSRQVALKRLQLAGGTLRLETGADSVSNFAFIGAAFAGPPDTLQPPPEETTGSSPWNFTANRASLSLRAIRVRYADEPAQTAFAVGLERLDAPLSSIDLQDGRYRLEKMVAAGIEADIRLGPVDTAAVEPSPTDLAIEFAGVELERIKFHLHGQGPQLTASAGALRSGEGYFRLQEGRLDLSLLSFLLENGRFQYDNGTAPPPTDGFDPGRFDFQDLTLAVAEVSYRDDRLQATILNFTGRDRDEFFLRNLKTRVEYSPRGIFLDGFALQTTGSDLKLNQSRLDWGPAEPAEWRIATEWDAAALSPADILYFYPALRSIPFFRENAPSLSSQGKLSGTLAELSVERIEARTRDIQLEMVGSVKELTAPEKLWVDLQIRRLSSTRRGIMAWMPPGALPDYLQLPEQGFLRGSIRGGLESLRLRLQGETRRGPTPLTAHIAATVELKEITHPAGLQFALQLDSFLIRRPDVAAYLPPGALPEGLVLPDDFRLEGNAAGRLASFHSNWRLTTYRGSRSTVYRLSGRVDSLQAKAGPRLDLTFDIKGLDRAELSALAPPAWVPQPVRWPDLQSLAGRLAGRTDSLWTEVRFAADLGEGSLAGTVLDRKAYDLGVDLSRFRPGLLFNPGYLDSLLGFSFAPLAVRLQATGRGFDPSPDTRSDVRLDVWKDGGVRGDEGLTLEAGLREQVLNANVRTREEGLRLAANLALDYGRAIAQTDLSFDLERLDLRALRVSETPLQLSGRIRAQAEGDSPDTLTARLLASQWAIAYDSMRQVVDSLLLTARMDNGDNDFRLTSDLLNAHLAGSFQFSRLSEALSQQFTRYLDREAADSLVGRTSDRFRFDMEICRPEVLTMGFLPDLQELGAAKWTMTYDNRRTQWENDLSVPTLRWADVQLDSIRLQASAAADAFQYRLSIQNVDVRQVARVPSMQWVGTYEADRLVAEFIALDERARKRFDLTVQLRRLEGPVYELRLEPRQLLDYQWWRASENNKLMVEDKTVRVQDWRLFLGREIVEIKELGKERLQVSFQHFDLDLLANVLDQEDPAFGGRLNGTVALTDPLAERKVNVDLKIDSLMLLDALLGDMAVNGNLDKQRVTSTVRWSGQGNDVRLAGRYAFDNADQALDFQLDLNRISLPALEPLFRGYLENARGALAGAVKIAGSVEKPRLDGAVRFDSAAFDVGLLNTRLRLGNQPIAFDRRGMTFQRLELFDEQNNRGVLAGGLETQDYRTFVFNTDLRAENFAVLNTTSADNDLYYGKLFVDANVLLSGALLQPVVDVFAKPRKGSDLTYVYRAGAPQVASWQGVVEFVSAGESSGGRFADPQLAEVSEELNLTVSVRMEVTENLTFRAITNPLTNDYFEGKANGTLTYKQFPSGQMELTGALEMAEGRYLFTYQEVVRRSFKVESGSTIRWTGDPLNPDLNIRVLYELETSPFPLLAQTAGEEGKSNRKELFRVLLSIGGTPSKTDIQTSVVYPDVPGNTNNPDVQAAIQQINRDPTQQNTQAFALILFGGFIGAKTTQTDFQIADLDLESNISNLITQQLNNLANRYIKFVDLDIDLEDYERKGEGFKDTQADFRVSLRKQFLNDRLSVSLDGVASAQTDPQTAGATYCLDNLTFEYDLTPDGRFRLKVYNQRDYDDIITGNSLKVGGALVFSRDFNEIRLTRKKD